MQPYYLLRLSRGLMFLIGAVLMAVNLYRTFRACVTVAARRRRRSRGTCSKPPGAPHERLGIHKAIERNTGLLIFGILVVASIGGLVQVLRPCRRLARSAAARASCRTRRSS